MLRLIPTNTKSLRISIRSPIRATTGLRRHGPPWAASTMKTSEASRAFLPTLLTGCRATNFDYLAAVMGLQGSVFLPRWAAAWSAIRCLETNCRARRGVSFYAVRPRKGVLSGTRNLFNFAMRWLEPALTDQFGSLYASGGEWLPVRAQQLNIGPLAAPAVRTYEGGGETGALFSDRSCCAPVIFITSTEERLNT